MDAKGSFGAVWETLGLKGRTFALGKTITPEMLADAAPELDATLAAPMRSADIGLPIATLPQLTILPQATEGDAQGVEHDISIVGLLGEGGMGRVLLAKQRSLARDVAVKTLHDAPFTAMHAHALVVEGLITGHLEHPNITPVHQLGIDGEGRPLLVMKRIAGVVWRELIDDRDHPAWQRIPTLPSDRLRAHIEILMQVCNGLSFAHSRHVVHRDVKPDNVMIGEFGEVYLCDWGIGVKLPRSGPHGLVGTPSYLAPEMLDRDGAIGPAIDVYLLGGTLHTILTGRPRHEGSTLEAVLEAAHVSAPHEYPADVDAELAELANRATAGEISRRPPSALAFRRELADYLSHRTSVALSDAASRLYGELEARLGEAEHDREACSRTAHECRFGFVQALREWKENPDALEGLERCLATAIRLEVEGEAPGNARLLLGEMRRPSAELSAEIEALEARLEKRRDDASALEVLRREQDLTVGARPRAFLMAALFAVAVSMSLVAFLLRRAGHNPDTNLGHVIFLSIILGAASTGTWVLRKQLLSNTVTRRTGVIVLGSMLLEWVHAMESWYAGADPNESHRSEMFIVAATTATAAVLIARSWAVATVLVLVGTVVASVWPSLTIPAFVLGHMSILVVIATGARGAAR